MKNENERKELYTIGEMSKLCNIPGRQLRYYDQIGVIKPNYRNPDTGYRYYTDDQIEPFLFLSNLRDIGISNESIQRLFINRDVDQLVQELQLNLTQIGQEIQASFARYRRIINALVLNTRTLAYLHAEEAICSPLYSEYWISIATLPAKHILSMRYHDGCHSCNRTEYVRHIAELNQRAAANHISLYETRMTIFHSVPIARLCEDFSDAVCEYELAQEIKETSDENSAEPCSPFGGYNTLSTVHVGSPATLSNAYCALRKWAEDHHVELADAAIQEVLADSFVSSNVNRFVTKIFIPLKSESWPD